MVGNRVLIIDENESILVVDQGVVKKVDERRGDVSRPEFLGSLIDSQLQESEREEQPSHADYVAREEFLQFARGMTELLRSFLEFFLSFGLEMAKPPQDDGFQELSQKLQALSNPGGTTAKL